VSRIFELLNKSKGEVADLVRPLVDEQTRRTPQTGGESQAGEISSAAPETPALASIRTLSLRIPAPSPLLPFEGGQWRPNEQYRILRTKISQCLTQPRVIVISSPSSGDGKSVTAINTAGALSLKSGADVLLLDAGPAQAGDAQTARPAAVPRAGGRSGRRVHNRRCPGAHQGIP